MPAKKAGGRGSRGGGKKAAEPSNRKADGRDRKKRRKALTALLEKPAAEWSDPDFNSALWLFRLVQRSAQSMEHQGRLQEKTLAELLAKRLESMIDEYGEGTHGKYWLGKKVKDRLIAFGGSDPARRKG